MLSKWSKIALLVVLAVMTAKAADPLVYNGVVEVEGENGVKYDFTLSAFTISDPAADWQYVGAAYGASGPAVQVPSSVEGNQYVLVFRNGVQVASVQAISPYRSYVGPLVTGDAMEVWFAVAGGPFPVPTSQRISWTVGPQITVPQRNVSYSFAFTNTDVQAHAVAVDAGGVTLGEKTIEAFQTETIQGVASVADGVEVRALSLAALSPVSGLEYDPFIVGAANTSVVRAFYVGPLVSELVECDILVQANNVSSSESWVRAFAGSLKLGEITVPTEDAFFRFLKVRILLPVGTVLSMDAQGGYFTILEPSNTVVATNNTRFHWIVSINAPEYRTGFDSSYTDNVSVVNYGNGQVLTTTPNVNGGQISTGANPVTPPVNGQTVTSPSGVVGNVGGQPVTGASVISGTGLANDRALLQGILANTAQIAQNTSGESSQTAEGLPVGMPDADRLEAFQPDQATTDALASLNPLGGKSIPAGQAPDVTMPFGELGVEGLSDQTLNFGNTNLNTWAGLLRTFLLFCVSGLFSYHTIRLISKTLGNV